MKSEKTRVVVVQCEGLRLGIVVDEVLDIVSVNVSQMAQGGHNGAINDEAVRGVVRGTVFFREKSWAYSTCPACCKVRLWLHKSCIKSCIC